MDLIRGACPRTSKQVMKGYKMEHLKHVKRQTERKAEMRGNVNEREYYQPGKDRVTNCVKYTRMNNSQKKHTRKNTRKNENEDHKECKK